MLNRGCVKLELIHTQTAQKPVLRAEVHAQARVRTWSELKQEDFYITGVHPHLQGGLEPNTSIHSGVKFRHLVLVF
jgi:hypothetical protein